MNSEHTDDKNAATGSRPVAAGGFVAGGGWTKRGLQIRKAFWISMAATAGWPLLCVVVGMAVDLNFEDWFWPFLVSEAVMIGFLLWYLFSEKPKTVEEVAPIRDYDPRNLY